jgi:hypothetical protein
MGDGAGETPNILDHPQSWLIRIRDGAAVLGAGVLLDADTVLTCAHVLGRPDRRVLVDLVGVEGAEAIPAGVAEDGWIPENGARLSGPGGDLALLRLEWPVSREHATPLQEQALVPRRPVLMHGFPKAADAGLPLRGELVGRSGGDGRWAIAPVVRGEVARKGFSGAGVLDLTTGNVIGIVVGRLPEREPLEYSFMIPTATVLSYLPGAKPRSRGSSALGAGRSVADARCADAEFAAQLADWFRADHAPDIQAVLVRTEDEARLSTLTWSLDLAAQELTAGERDRRVAEAPPGTVPPAGSLGIRVDVSGRTQEEVAQRLWERVMGDGPDGPHPGEPLTERLRRSGPLPLAIVADGVDRSADDEGLTALLGLLAENESRLLLVFHEAGEGARAEAEAGARFRARLGEVARRVSETIGRGNRFSDLRVLVTAGRGPGPGDAEPIDLARSELSRVYVARARLSSLRRNGARRGPAREGELEDVSRAEAVARRRIDRAIGLLEPRRDRRDVLRGRLAAAQAGARELFGPEERPELSDLYHAARRLLWRAPCDVEAAEVAVDRYLAVLRGGPDGGEDGGGERGRGR